MHALFIFVFAILFMHKIKNLCKFMQKYCINIYFVLYYKT